MNKLCTIAVPNKGRLSERALELLAQAGMHVPRHARSLLVDVNGRWRVLFVRTGDIPEYVATGTADAGITGLDLVAESRLLVETLLPLGFGHCRLVVAALRLSKITTLEQLEGKRVATAFPNSTGRFFAEHTVNVEIVPLSGATEVAPHAGVAEAIADLVETGSTLRQNGLIELETVLHSEAVLIVNQASLKTQRVALHELQSALKSVLDARAQRYLMVNVPKGNLDQVKALLPGVTAPTVMNLLGRDDWVALHAVVHEDEINGLIPALKRLGVQGLLILPIERMVP
jgi:ATP phosphoribosyltransferase